MLLELTINKVESITAVRNVMVRQTMVIFAVRDVFLILLLIIIPQELFFMPQAGLTLMRPEVPNILQYILGFSKKNQQKVHQGPQTIYVANH